jgi:transcriptional regulator with XRE-family HTH domain
MTQYQLDTERLRMRRLRLRLSQEQLGKMIGQSQAYVSRLEHGTITDITLGTFARLADALGVTMEYLIGKGSAECEYEPADAELVEA